MGRITERECYLSICYSGPFFMLAESRMQSLLPLFLVWLLVWTTIVVMNTEVEYATRYRP